ncbi:2228_t:CDS:2 [Entrophospora sp. SA101]|nr:2228_t:CDS:2 [Entrophospora sp. SA101]
MSKEQSSDLSFALLRDIDILRYIYTGKINLDVKEAPQDLLDLLIVAEELVLSDLVDYIQDYIIHNEIEWLKLNLVRVLQTTLKHKSWHKLRAYCEETICEDASSDVNEWSDEDVTNIKQSIKECLPHIRFFQISSANYYYKVRPYKRLLPTKLKEDLKMFHLVPGSESNIDKISKPSYNNINREFQLLVRGSRDGLSRDVFREKCDNKGSTLVVLKITGTNKSIIGGYNPIAWSSSGEWLSTNDSFIFSFDDNMRKVLSRVVNSEQAIRDCGPQFDLVGFGEDLNIFTRTCYMRDYERGIIDAINFNLLDYEVFQIIEK